MPSKPHKPIAALIEELKSWLTNYDHGEGSFPHTLFRILASVPGGEELQDMGYEPFKLGWYEIEQLGRILTAIQDSRDVEDIVAALMHEEEEEVEERRRRPVREVRRHPMAVRGRSVPPPPPPRSRPPA